MKQSILSVHVVDARDLRPQFGNVTNAQVRLMIEGTRTNTREIVYSNNPVWNEVISFDIERADDNLKVQVLDVEVDNVLNTVNERKRSVIGEIDIDLRDLSREQVNWMRANNSKSQRRSFSKLPNAIVRAS